MEETHSVGRVFTFVNADVKVQSWKEFSKWNQSDRMKKQEDLWAGRNFISNQSHGKIVTERRGEAAGGALIGKEDLIFYPWI